MRLTAIVSAAALSMSTKMKNGDTPRVAMHWFRKGLRLHDNPALMKSLTLANDNGNNNSKNKVFPVYVMDGDCYQLRHCSALRANFLVECLQDLDASLRDVGSRLYVVSGDPTNRIPELCDKWGVTHVTWEADETLEPYALERDTRIQQRMDKAGIEVHTFCSETLFPLEAYVDKVKGIAKVPGTMGAFQTLVGRMGRIESPLEAPTQADFATLQQDHGEYEGEMVPPEKATDLPWPRNTPRKEVTPVWGPHDCQNITPLARGGETQALQTLRASMKKPAWVASFEKPKTSCTSLTPSTTTISPYMSVGCLSPRTVWYAITEAIERAPASTPKSKPPVSLHGQMLWRDFNNLIAHSANQQHAGSWGQMEHNVYCRDVPWSTDTPHYLEAWKKGETGYPWIDACMIQLKTEGWIHHLGRHAVACFLTRGDLWQSWEEGALYFESQLLDADYALNGFNWLWLSCSGFFYQYFRCYSPVAFQQKNDKSGAYIRKWLPQLAKLPDKYIYEPWKAPLAVQKAAGIRIGVDYPKPLVDHGPTSKENMSKMAYAYDLHKEKMGEAKKSTKTKTKGATAKGAPAKKKQKRQTKLKF